MHTTRKQQVGKQPCRKQLCNERELALEEVVFVDASDGTCTATEQERDAAVAHAAEKQAMNAHLQQQLAGLQQAAAAATAQATQQQQQPHQQQQEQKEALELEQQAAADWLLDFTAEEAMVPKLTGTPAEQQTAYLLRLLTLKQAAKFSSLPRMTFHQLSVEPWFLHRLVGDEIWAACWAERAPAIADGMVVPQKLLNIALHVVTSLDNVFREKATDAHRAAAAQTISEQQEAAQKRARTDHA